MQLRVVQRVACGQLSDGFVCPILVNRTNKPISFALYLTDSGESDICGMRCSILTKTVVPSCYSRQMVDSRWTSLQGRDLTP